jgi:LmbE family N-acetylglucosaminyl deacetylase
VICSRGEAATHGTPVERTAEAQKSAEMLGATAEFLKFEGDAHLEVRAAHALKLAGIIRAVRPAIVLAPSLVNNQHPDHSRLGQLALDATRLARFGGVPELRAAAPHVIEHLFFYAVGPEAEPQDLARVFFDVSAPEILKAWQSAMEAHASQMLTRNYVEIQLTRARLNGLRAGTGHAIALFPSEPLVLESLGQLRRAGRRG